MSRVDFDGSKIPLPPFLFALHHRYLFFLSPRIKRRIWQVTLSRCIVTSSALARARTGSFGPHSRHLEPRTVQLQWLVAEETGSRNFQHSSCNKALKFHFSSMRRVRVLLLRGSRFACALQKAVADECWIFEIIELCRMNARYLIFLNVWYLSNRGEREKRCCLKNEVCSMTSLSSVIALRIEE